MKAVLRAILMDPEARGDIKIDPAYGKTARTRAVPAQPAARVQGRPTACTSRTRRHVALQPGVLFAQRLQYYR